MLGQATPRDRGEVRSPRWRSKLHPRRLPPGFTFSSARSAEPCGRGTQYSALPPPAPASAPGYLLGSPNGDRTRDLRLERAVSWATRRWDHVAAMGRCGPTRLALARRLPHGGAAGLASVVACAPATPCSSHCRERPPGALCYYAAPRICPHTAWSPQWASNPRFPA